ncbi:zf-HC2 domain-containing protein [Treponema vincentii]|jgi:hypothetical protein|uniref:anti-sigma factor family protein n=1 Tax=Treponema vincentii TaxID=69710 RepID=UPI003D91D0AD
MSTCPNKDLLSAYIDGELTFPWKETVERHLQECAVCSKIYGKYAAVDRYMQELSGGTAFDTDVSFAKLLAKRNTVLQDKLKTPKRRWRIGLGGRWFSSSIRVPVPAAAAAVLVFVLMPLMLFFKVESTVNSIAANQSSFTPIIPVSIEKQKPIAEMDYGITNTNDNQSYAVSTKAVNTNAKFFTVGEFARLYSKNESLFQPVQSTVDLKISSSSFPLSTEYQTLYMTAEPDLRISNR